jgi:hypothetical protein
LVTPKGEILQKFPGMMLESQILGAVQKLAV